jgi:hypothetical protein
MEQNLSSEARSPSDGEGILHPLPEPEDIRWSQLLEFALELLNP